MNRDCESGSLRNLNSVCASTAFGLFAALSASDLAPSLRAQEAAPAPTGSTTNAPAALPEVVVTGEQTPGYKPAAIASPKIVTPPRDTPQTINVVPRKVIEDQNATTLRDVLRNVPGISFQAGEGGVPAGDQLTIRGFSARTDLFIDGFRDAGGYTRDSFNLEQVEVFKGPNSAYSGRGSTGGSVNMVTKAPKLNSFYDATLGYGSAKYYRATADVNLPVPESSGIKGGAFRLNGLYQDQDFAGRDYVHDNRWALNPTFAVGLGSETRATFSYLHLQEDNLAGYGLPFVNTSNNPFGGAAAVGKVAPVSYHRFFGLVNRDYEDVANDVANLKLEHNFSENLKLQNQTRYGRTYRDSVITAPRIVQITAANVNDPIFGPNTVAAGHAAPGSVAGTSFGLNHELQSRDQTTQLMGNQTDLRANFDTGKFEHQSTVSLEIIHEEEINYLRSALVPGSPLPAQTSDPRNPNPFDPHHPVYRTGANNQIFGDGGGISAFDTIKLHEKFLINGGLRGDVFSADYHQISTNGVQFLNPTRTDLAATWRAGAVYKPLPNGSIFFGYGTSFNPSAEGLTLATNTAALNPETGVNYEFGSKWDLFAERLSVTGALFRTDKDNYRNTDPATGVISASGEVRVQGVELGVSGKITEQWSVYLSYALMESEVLKSKTRTTYNGQLYNEQGHRLANTPDQTASVSTTYELPHHVTLGTGVFFVDERYSNNIGTQSAPGYWLQDASVAWSVNEHWYLRLNVLNLWDQEYIDRVGGGHAIPGAGRTVILTAGIHF